jgi:nucleotidyltransferase/DNA polymerase involved in DNA repair
MCSLVIGCALIPRFSLTVAVGGRRELLGRAVALAPMPGSPQVVGESSGAAEAFGVVAGIGLGEALARCPELALVPPDPERADAAWERALVTLEGIGAAVWTERAGEAFFAVRGLRGLWGGNVEGVLERARRAIELPARLGAGPTRLAAAAAALRSGRWRADRPPSGAAIRGRFVVVPDGAARAFLAPQPIALLRDRLEQLPTAQRAQASGDPGAAGIASLPGAVGLVDKLERLGIRTLGELAELPDDAVADRFGAAGLAALRMARGERERLHPRRPREELAEALELPEAASGFQLERTLELLVDRLLANPRRRGRSFRRLRLFARLAAGGGWRADAALRQASADRLRVRLALEPKLAELPAPAASLGLRALALGPAGGEQHVLAREERERRRERIGEAVRQARAAGGTDAVLRVLEIDPDSRVPERRVALTPYPEGEPEK